MHTIAKGQFGGAEPLKKLVRETRRIAERGEQGFAPVLGGFGSRRGGDNGAGHLTFAPDTEEADELTCRVAALGAAAGYHRGPVP